MIGRPGILAWLALAGFGAALARGELPVVVGSDLLGARFEAQVRTMAEEAGWAVSFDLVGTRPGLARLRAGEAVVGIFLLPPGEEPPAGEFFSRAIGYQTATVVVPESSPLRQLALDQVRGVFVSGARVDCATWGDLGVAGEWRARPIAAHAVAAGGSLALPLMQRLVFAGAELKPTVLLADDTGQLARRVRAGDNTLGLATGVPAPGSGLRAVALAAGLTVPAYAPTAENVHDGSYPLRLPLYLCVRRTEAVRLLPLLRIVLSEGVAEALAAADFQPLPVAARNQAIFELEDVR